jgi:hypothetical protein
MKSFEEFSLSHSQIVAKVNLLFLQITHNLRNFDKVTTRGECRQFPRIHKFYKKSFKLTAFTTTNTHTSDVLAYHARIKLNSSFPPFSCSRILT